MARQQKLKIYRTNYGGVDEAVVAATSQKAACEFIGCSLSDFRAFGSEATSSGRLAFAIENPGVVFLRSYKIGSVWRKKA